MATLSDFFPANMVQIWRLGAILSKKKLLCMSHSPLAFVTKWQKFITKENTGSGVQNWFEIE
jgi:hypothetical protein